jgi:hypothetical protein
MRSGSRLAKCTFAPTCPNKAMAHFCAYHVRQIEKQGCAVHDGSIHGREAEELRSGIEKIIIAGETSADDEQATDVYDALITLLDRVDARDSLAFSELRDRAKKGWKTRKANEKKRAAKDKQEALQAFALRRS